MAFPADGDSRTPRPPRPPLRASDADRSATVHVLQDAIGRGLLTPEEGSERMAAAFAAVHVQDLAPLTADLPPAPGGSPPPGWRPLAVMALDQLRSSLGGSVGLRPARVAVVVLLTVLLVVVAGFLTTEFLLGGGGPDPGGFGVGAGGRG